MLPAYPNERFLFNSLGVDVTDILRKAAGLRSSETFHQDSVSN